MTCLYISNLHTCGMPFAKCGHKATWLCMAAQHLEVWKGMPRYLQASFSQKCNTLEHQICKGGGYNCILTKSALLLVPARPPQPDC